MRTRMIQSCIELPEYDQIDISKEYASFNGGKNISMPNQEFPELT